MEPSRLLGDIAVDMAHESGKGLRIRSAHYEMHVVGYYCEEINPKFGVDKKSSAQHTQNQLGPAHPESGRSIPGLVAAENAPGWSWR